MPFMMKFVIIQAVIHCTSFLITLKPIHVCSPSSSVLQAACNLNGIVCSTGDCTIMLGQEDPTVMSSHGVSSVMLGICFGGDCILLTQYCAGDKTRRMRWAGRVVHMGEERGVYRVLVGKPEGNRPLGRPRRRWVDNIRMDLMCG